MQSTPSETGSVRVIGIDPGSRHTGVAILEKRGGQFHTLLCTVIHTTSPDDHSTRIQAIYQRISSIIDEYKPTVCAIETPVYGKDPLALLKLGRAQASCILAAANKGLDVLEYYPKAVKKAITGQGNANKDQVAFMLKKILKITEMKYPRDATDALAVAWCHISRTGGVAASGKIPVKKTHQNRNKSVSSWESFLRENPERIKG